MGNGSMTFLEAANYLLQERGPMHYKDLAKSIIEAGLVQSKGSTPDATVSAILGMEIKQKGEKSTFIRIKPGVFGLRGLHESGIVELKVEPSSPEDETGSASGYSEDEGNTRVRIPIFPLYSELRCLLQIWPGYSRKQVTGLRSAISELQGTPQKTVDWTEPASWIPDRLDGDDKILALDIWERSKNKVNPRHIYGHWLLAQKYRLLIENSKEILELTETGRDFLQKHQGEAEVAIDEAEGLIKLISIVGDNGPARAGGLLTEWSDYLKRYSRFGTDSTFKDTLRRRLNNLLERGFIERKGSLYSVTQDGLAYLHRAVDDDPMIGSDYQDIRLLVRKHEITVRDTLRELLLGMDPYAFEHLVKQLLEEMGYQNVEVTARSGDGGVDVVGDIELGITSVREVVQVKKHRKAIQRKDLDALRGSLYRFNAVRGTLVTTARFAKGTQEAAFATGAAPITLIDGNKLIDLLIEHKVGVRRKSIEILEIDEEPFTVRGKDMSD